METEALLRDDETGGCWGAAVFLTNGLVQKFASLEGNGQKGAQKSKTKEQQEQSSV